MLLVFDTVWRQSGALCNPEFRAFQGGEDCDETPANCGKWSLRTRVSSLREERTGIPVRICLGHILRQTIIGRLIQRGSRSWLVPTSGLVKIR